MSAYGYQNYVRPGTPNGIEFSYVESKQANAAFDYGDPVFIKAGTPDVAYIPDSTDATKSFLGVAMLDQKSTKTTFGQYDAGDAVNVGTRGEVWVQIESGLTTIAGTAAYVYHNVSAGVNHKKFTTNATGTYAVGSIFRTNSVTTTLVINGTLTTIYVAILELRGLK